MLLADTPLLKVVGSYTTGREAIQGIADVCPDVALIALGLPDMSGVEVIQHVTAQSSPTECVVLTVYDDNAHPFPALRAVEAAAVFRGARKR